MKIHKTITSAATVAGLSLVFSSTALGQSQPGQASSPANAARAARKLAQEVRVMPADAAPVQDGDALVLNLKPLYRSIFATLAPEHARLVDFLGRQVIDGVPLLIEGNVVLYGKVLEQYARGDARINPRLIRGVQVGRAFDELHLAHVAAWPDVPGRTIALVTLNYRDGTRADLPIVFGAHLLGDMRTLAEEDEALTDPDSKIIWRGPGPGSAELHAEHRLFKSMLRNPQPGKIVDTIDLKSADAPLASYKLVAATVTPSDPKRAVTPALPAHPPRDFDGRLLVHVLDGSSHQPLANAVIWPALKIEGIFLAGTLVLTSADGEATIRYPVASTTGIRIEASKNGVVSHSDEWRPGTTRISLELGPTAR